jgi:hypothetical protein
MSLVDDAGVVDFKALNGHYKRFATTRARAGLKWLKELGDNNLLKLSLINPETLNLADGYECVLSQASGGAHYSHMTSQFGFTDKWIVEHGFEGCCCEEWEHNEQHVRLYNALNSAWKELLAPQESVLQDAAR